MLCLHARRRGQKKAIPNRRRVAGYGTNVRSCARTNGTGTGYKSSGTGRRMAITNLAPLSLPLTIEFSVVVLATEGISLFFSFSFCLEQEAWACAGSFAL